MPPYQGILCLFVFSLPPPPLCQEKKAGTPTAELVNDFSLEKEVRDVTSDTDNNKVVENDKRLMD